MKFRHYFLILPALLLSGNSITAQSKSLGHGIQHISEYIASEEFQEFKKTHHDIQQIDKIYLKTLEFYEGDISETLLTLTFVMLPFNEMPLQIPVMRIDLTIPLPAATDSIYKVKNENLPKRVLFDSPNIKFGDKDKTAHFFAMAFFEYNIHFFNLSKFIGIFVEYFEDVFKVQGSIDERDLLVNYLGSFFGEGLRENPSMLPSDALAVYLTLFFIG